MQFQLKNYFLFYSQLAYWISQFSPSFKWSCFKLYSNTDICTILVYNVLQETVVQNSRSKSKPVSCYFMLFNNIRACCKWSSIYKFHFCARNEGRKIIPRILRPLNHKIKFVSRRKSPSFIVHLLHGSMNDLNSSVKLNFYLVLMKYLFIKNRVICNQIFTSVSIFGICW